MRKGRCFFVRLPPLRIATAAAAAAAAAVAVFLAAAVYGAVAVVIAVAAGVGLEEGALLLSFIFFMFLKALPDPAFRRLF